MDKSYQPDAIEGRWYKEWEEKGESYGINSELVILHEGGDRDLKVCFLANLYHCCC